LKVFFEPAGGSNFAMKNQRSVLSLKSACALFSALFAMVSLQADPVRTQTINLHQGWNAVYLEVAPTNASPAAVFANTPVSIAAVFFGGDSPVQFIQNPGSIAWKKDGWSVWYAPSRPDAFLGTLFAINGNRAYLIYADQDFVWNVTGNVSLGVVKWKPNSYNLAGFGVDAVAPPTFGKFFAGSSAHQPGKVYRLMNGQWNLIASPTTTAMKSGEACWIFCKGASDYQGPITVKLSTGDNISFGSTTESPVSLENRTTDPLAVKVETVASAGGVPLGYMVRGVTEGKMVEATFDLPAQYTPPTMEAGQTSWLWLTLRREKMTATTQDALLKISTDSGAVVWVPVTGTLNP
jgi:hypothetical protein